MYICIKSNEIEMVLEVSRLLCNDEEIVVAFRGGGTLRIENFNSEMLKVKALYNKVDKIDTVEIGSETIHLWNQSSRFIATLKKVLMEG